MVINMKNTAHPITKIEGNRFQIMVDLELYAKESITAACYKFSNTFFIHQAQNGNSVEVIFEDKGDNHVTEVAVKEFCNELLDQQLRYNTNLQFGKIRDMIVEEAFRPINSKKY